MNARWHNPSPSNLRRVRTCGDLLQRQQSVHKESHSVIGLAARVASGNLHSEDVHVHAGFGARSQFLYRHSTCAHPSHAVRPNSIRCGCATGLVGRLADLHVAGHWPVHCAANSHTAFNRLS